ncbi:M23 family metallopeptidase [Sporichthya sp.]|uniref:murein hydrolase activator EnvC family protein n=1 Tax=Sporichthya sp. TaxID=65475 RepID=UPI001843C994|nr:M23 family metallopeptidase [Sporichthya sp.]MBA3745374.1 peptidoglycan DD-metalloendopeptidase family protein [Sporichthya sp.]
MRRTARHGGLAMVVAVALATFLLPQAQADDNPKDKKRAVDEQVQQLGEDLDEQNAEVKAAGSALADAEAKLPPAQAALASARTALASAEQEQFDAALSLAATESHAEQALIEYLGAQGQMRAHREALAALARQAYMGGDFQRLSVVMNAQSPEDLTSAMSYYETVNRSEKQVLADLNALQADLETKQAALDESHERILAEQKSAAAAVETTTRARNTATAAQAQVQTLIAARGVALEKAEDLKDEIEARLAVMKAESDRLAEVIRKRAEAARKAAEKTGKKIVQGTGLLSRPVSGPITSPYGMRYHPILHRYKLHTGTDFGVPSGTAVRAARDGTVIEAYYNSAYGNRVVVDHGYVNGVYLVTTYNHLTRDTVSRGEKLERGEVLGYSGSTGYSTGPHLHFETMEDGHFVDPMRWLE